MPTHANRLGVGKARIPGTQGGLVSRLTRVVRVLAVTLILVGLPLQSGLAAPLMQDTVFVITSPGNGATLSGEVAIQGTATHANFASYGILYAPGSKVTGSTSWDSANPVAWNVQTMVVNGVLATWDTTQVPNGPYVLALVGYEVGNDNPMLYFVENLTVNNEEATPTPEPTATPDEAAQTEPTEEPLPPVTAEAIIQPPTATPRPTPTLAPEGASGTGNAGNGDSGGLLNMDFFSMKAVKQAFVLGAQLAFLIYAVGLLYVLAKAVIRYYLRQTKRKPSP